jgi:hypothetical protein
MLAKHAAEPLDATWAAAANASLSSDVLDTAKASQFEVTAVDCRSTTCTAELRWPTFALASSNYVNVVQQRMALACTREMTLAKPIDPETPYIATAFFDCSADRSKQR